MRDRLQRLVNGDSEPWPAQPLDAENVTASLRIMLPTYVALFGILGVSYFATPLRRLLQTPPLAYAHEVMPLRAWAVGFIVISLLMGWSLATRNRGVYRYALWLGVVSMTIFAAVFGLAAFRGTATYSAWVWPALAAIACYASSRSLAKGERRGGQVR